ncbi:MAG: hypothetical protein RL385_5838, partial [Pseudomonadota bacterium]
QRARARRQRQGAAVQRVRRARAERGERLGLVRTGDRRILGAMALGALKELMLQCVEGRIKLVPRELTDEVMRFLATGILTPDLVVEAALSTNAPAQSPRRTAKDELLRDAASPSDKTVH